MTIIFSTPEIIQRQWETKASRILITNPPDDEANEIIFDVVNVPYDNNVPNYDQTVSQPPLRVNFNDVETQIITIYDPVTGQNVSISIAGVAQVIQQAFVNWVQAQ